MIILRPAAARGYADHGWLKSFHTFSFAGYHDEAHMGFRDLRVINEDRVAPGRGFSAHGHQDMEIISYVLSGALAHEDSMGNGSVIRPGDVQYMSAGTGVKHSEFNASPVEPVHFMQIWIMPAQDGLSPQYAQHHVAKTAKQGALRLIASGDGTSGSIMIRQDVRLYASVPQIGQTLSHPLNPGRGAWLQVLSGSLMVNQQILQQGDGAAIEDESQLEMRSVPSAEQAAEAETEFLLFDCC